MPTVLGILAAAALTVLDLTGTPRRFPQVKAHRLDGRAITLPAGLDGKVNLVVVAFARDQQAAVETWGPAAQALVAKYPGLAWYEVPLIGPVPGFVRWFIENGMRAGLPQKAVQARTISLYVDRKPFEKVLGITDEKQVHAFLLDRTGKVLWAAAGTLDGKTPPPGLEAAVKAALAPAPAAKAATATPPNAAQASPPAAPDTAAAGGTSPSG